MPRTRSNSAAKQKGGSVGETKTSTLLPQQQSRSRSSSNAPQTTATTHSIPLQLSWIIQNKHVLIAGGGSRMPPLLSTLLNAGANITVVCPQGRILPPSLRDLLETDTRVHYIDRHFISYDLKNVLNSFGPVLMLFSTHEDLGKAVFTVDTAKQRNIPVHSVHFPEMSDFEFSSTQEPRITDDVEVISRTSTATRIVEKVKTLMEEQQKTVAFEAASVAIAMKQQQKNLPSEKHNVRFSPVEDKIVLNAEQEIHNRDDSASKSKNTSQPVAPSTHDTSSSIPYSPLLRQSIKVVSTWSLSTAESYLTSVKQNISYYSGLVLGRNQVEQSPTSLTTTVVSLAVAPVAITAATASTSYNLASQATATTSCILKSTTSRGIDATNQIVASVSEKTNSAINSAKHSVTTSTLAASNHASSTVNKLKSVTETSINYSLSFLPVTLDAPVRGAFESLPLISYLQLGKRCPSGGKLQVLEFNQDQEGDAMASECFLKSIHKSHVVVCDINTPVSIVAKIKSNISSFLPIGSTKLKFVEGNGSNETIKVLSDFLGKGCSVVRVRDATSSSIETDLLSEMGHQEENITAGIINDDKLDSLPTVVQDMPSFTGPPKGYVNRGRRQSIAYESPLKNSDPARGLEIF